MIVKSCTAIKYSFPELKRSKLMYGTEFLFNIYKTFGIVF